MAISNAPWGNVSESDYASPEQFCSACLIDLNPSGEQKTKANCKLPVRMPNGDVNRNALQAAAAVLAGGRGGVDAPPAAKQAAARKLARLYAEAGMEMPESMRRMMG